MVIFIVKSFKKNIYTLTRIQTLVLHDHMFDIPDRGYLQSMCKLEGNDNFRQYIIIIC